uniref:VWFA domain-containing protein n=1 Tax=Candidatus Kentrum sp. LPFa TaxID=2126335 RepID=A0A450WCX1_9GAMM|nr:MAG: hypothetical protein BECKLPF1236B_GA0070989_106912 [Candidatus Kentron sp. LPFa]
MFHSSNHYRYISHSSGLCFLFLLLFSGQASAECADNDLDFWRQGDGWKSGALIWAGADNIPVHAKPDKDAFKGEYLEFNSPALPIQDERKKGGNIWLQVLRANERSWIRAGDTGVLCRSSPLKAKNSHLLRKVIPRVENREGKDVFIQARLRPRNTEDIERKDIRIFEYFFVYAKHGDWRLLGRGDILDSFNPRLLGWVRERDLIRWDTRNVAQPNSGAKFFLRPGDRDPIARATEEKWGKSTRRPPITTTKTVEKQRYLRVVLPVNFEAHQRHSRNLTLLARAEDAWRRPTIVFLVDGTHSTEPYLKEIHALLNTLLDSLAQEGRSRDLTLRYALYAYTDAAYGAGYHTRRYQGATDSTWSIRRAFEVLEENTREILANPVSDDYPEDLYTGIRRIQEEVLTDKALQESLPVLIVIGDHGGHERKTRRTSIRPGLKAVVPYFIQMGRQDGRVPSTTNCQNPGKLDQREKRYCAFRRFEEDATDLLGEGFEENRTFFRGEDPQLLANQVKKVLKDVLNQQGRTPLAVDSLAIGQPWKEASHAAGWPLVYTDAFRELLLSQGYDETILDRGNFVAVQEVWVRNEQITPEVFITKQELYRWISLFERMARPENWTAERVREIFATSVGIYAKEKHLWQLPLREVFEKRIGIPFRNTSLLRITPEEMTGLEQENVRYYARLFSHFREALERISEGRLSEIKIVRDDTMDRESITMGDPVSADLWFKFAPGVEAAYLEPRYLP